VIGGANEVGDDEAAELRRLMDDAGLGDSLLGSRDSDEIAKHLAAADVFVLPSHWEGQPIAVLEAMASGLPIMGTRVGAMPDVVRDGTDGLLVEPHDVAGLADALARLLGDEPLRREMGANARRRIEDGYDLTAFRRRVQDLYDSHLPPPG
jgi:glycosyltransferase involved in cell wall biosynthesis